MKVTADSTLQEILNVEGAEPVLKQNGVPCMTCPLASYEINQLQIGQVAKIYGLNLEKILKDLEELDAGE